MLYAFIQSSNYSNVYNILEPEALDLESYRRYIEQNHVNSNNSFPKILCKKIECNQNAFACQMAHRYGAPSMSAVLVSNPPNSFTSIWSRILWQRPCIGQSICWMKGFALCITAGTWTLSLPIRYRKMLIDLWSGMDLKSIVRHVANHLSSIQNWPGNKYVFFI